MSTILTERESQQARSRESEQIPHPRKAQRNKTPWIDLIMYTNTDREIERGRDNPGKKRNIENGIIKNMEMADKKDTY